MIFKTRFFKWFLVLIILLPLAYFVLAHKSDHLAYSTAKVRIEHTANGYQLLKNNKPFVIKGAATDSLFLKELSQAGANTIRVYDTLGIKQILDDAYANNLSVMIDLPIQRCLRELCDFYEDETFIESNINTFTKFVSRYKDHPALLMWVLGNEIKFPKRSESKNFYSFFNRLVRSIRNSDPNHPLTTAISNSSKTQITRIALWCEPLDAIGFNSFGGLGNMENDLSKTSLLWKGPFIITEWGINGPWEAAAYTKWGAQIEDNSTKKAEQYVERYQRYINLKNGRFLGDIFFYWGKKQERTHTWYSTFLDDSTMTQTALEMTNIWKQSEVDIDLPRIKYLLIEEKGANKSLVFQPETSHDIELVLEDNTGDYTLIEWEILPENWYYRWHDVEKRPTTLFNYVSSNSLTTTFKTPKKEGPYRIFCAIKNKNGQAATTNIPFYVLKPNQKL
ncbi:glycoside hydrolase family 2 TIM barrel-domain containing protein [Spongiivirga sp. MCCC 1A20706]|uniref:glycoside hydrolase family 2 TIM barrel-domain containing protein n=1 Tax=Spongiivirga sp. MCCC 1A20706 TaxID=3160963 RepID=UPI0039778239